MGIRSQKYEFKNISLFDYLRLKDQSEVNYILTYSRKFNLPIDTINIGDLKEKPFGIIKDIQYDLAYGMSLDNLINYVVSLSGKNKNEVMQMGVIQFWQLKSYIIDEITTISELENNGLNRELEMDEEKAGIDRFSKYGAYLQFRDLANNDILKIDEVKKKKWIDCFLELRLRKEIADYEKELTRIKYPIQKDY